MISIALDGPAGAGKSTVAKELASRLSYIYVDTGAMYRTIGYYVDGKGCSTTDGEQVSKLLPQINISIKYTKEAGQRIYLNGKDVSDGIRSPKMAMAASNVSAIPEVRDFLLELQRDCAKKNNVIMDGRDIGTVVLPNATLKIYLTATSEQRAKRRVADYLAKGIEAKYEEVLEDIQQRDYNDSHRAVAPLKQAEDAFLVDSTEDTLEQTIEKILNLLERRL